MAEELNAPEPQAEPQASGDNLAQPQVSTTQPDQTGGGNPPKPESNQDYYFQRQAEKARKEADEAAKQRDELAEKLKAKEDAELSEVERERKETADAKKEAEVLRKSMARLEAIMEAELPKELAELVPEGLDNPKEYIEKKVLPLKDKLVAPQQFGNPTQPGRQDIPDEEQRIVDKFRSLTDPKERQAFYNQHYQVLQQRLPGKV